MKRIAFLLPLLPMLLLPPTAWAAPGAERTLPGGLADGPPPLDPEAAAWTAAPATAVRLYPQATTPGGPGGAPIDLEARILLGDGRLALRLAWPDATADTADAVATHRFADAAAVQFAAMAATGPGCPPVGAGLPAISDRAIAAKAAPTEAVPACRTGTLPYVGMGEPGRPVQVWLWRAGKPAERLTAQGFGSLAKAASPVPETQASRTATGWAVVLRGEMESKAPLALAFAAWDGAEDGRAGRKRLSAWRVPQWPGERLERLAEEAQTTGDAGRGERLYAAQGCAGCHAPASGLAPDLGRAGGIHWPGYLRRAIREPAAFLVPGYPAIMPALPLRADEVEDLVAYLTTLK